MRRSRSARGFTLIETMLALALLAVVMMSLAGGLGQSIRMVSLARSTGAARTLAVRYVRQLQAEFQAGDPAVANLSGTVGCPLDSQNEIDFTQSPVSGYQALVPLQFGDSSSSQTENFDVRWNIQQVRVTSGSPSSNSVYLITVGVRPPEALNSNVVTLHAIAEP